MKIEVGMYVRAINGIKQIYKIDENKTKWKYLYKLKKQDGDGCIDLGSLCEEDIIEEPSHKPIDLIKVGDYVNGYKVLYQADCYSYFDIDTCEWVYIKNTKDIKTILTKEQFEREIYKI